MKRIVDEKVKMQWVSDVGMSLELYVSKVNRDPDDSTEYPLLKIIADDEDEKQYLEVVSRGEVVQLPISAIKEMIFAAEKDVHSDTWYDTHMNDKGSNT